MFKKITSFLLLSFIILSFIQSAHAQKNFNPETNNFSKMKTIKTWIADKHHSNKNLMEKIQFLVAEIVPANPVHKDHIIRMTGYDNKDKDKYLDFGVTFPTSEGIELPFLQHVKKISKIKENIVTLEIAAGICTVSWKLPLAFSNKGTHYINDLMTGKYLNDLMDIKLNQLKHFTKKDFTRSIKTIPDNCFDILEKHPELAGKVDVIYIQNLEHLLSPKEHQKLLVLIKTLLAPEGKAFLSSYIKSPACKYGSSLSDCHKSMAEILAKGRNHIYSGFVEFDEVAIVDDNNDGRAIDTSSYSNLKHLGYFDKLDRTPGKKRYVVNGYTHVQQHSSFNYIFPEVYKKSIALHSELEVIDTFYINYLGLRDNEGLDSKEQIVGSAAIIRKKDDNFDGLEFDFNLIDDL